MISYIPQTNFRRKDFLASGNPDKLIVAAELASEFEAIQRSFNSHTTGLYTVTTAFRPKDFFPTGTPGKLVRGTELDTEFDNIAIALAVFGCSYTPAYDGAALDAADAEITGTPIQVELESIATCIEHIRADSEIFYIITEDAEFYFITTETADDQLVTE